MTAKKFMTARQYQAAIDELGLSQVAAAKFLGICARQSRRIAAGDAEIGRAAALLLRVMVANEISPQRVEEIVRR